MLCFEMKMTCIQENLMHEVPVSHGKADLAIYRQAGSDTPGARRFTLTKKNDDSNDEHT